MYWAARLAQQHAVSDRTASIAARPLFNCLSHDKRHQALPHQTKHRAMWALGNYDNVANGLRHPGQRLALRDRRGGWSSAG